MIVNSVKLFMRFLPVHSIVIFTLIGLLFYFIFKNQKAKTTFLFFWGLLFVCLYGHPMFAALSLAITFIVYFLSVLLIKTTSVSRKKVLMILGIIVSLGTLILFKYPALKSQLPLFLQVKALGVSYFTFKFLHVLIDTYRGRIKDLDLLTFFAFIFFFPTFSAGPIDRYPRFKRNIKDDKLCDSSQTRLSQQALNSLKERFFATLEMTKSDKKDFSVQSETKKQLSYLAKEDVDIGVSRIIIGLFKKFIIADKTGILIARLAPDILKASRPVLWFVVFLYSIRIYYDFSGYTDIAIGLSRLFVFKVPENFNKPYLKPNIVAFWQNWHMSLTSWLREYLFMPIGKMLIGFMGTGHTWFINSICQLITMAAVGIWHGSTAGFLIWGLYHGIGLSLYKVYSDLLKKYGSERFLDLLNASRIVHYGSVAITFVFVSIGWVFFSFRWETAIRIIGRMIGV